MESQAATDRSDERPADSLLLVPRRQLRRQNARAFREGEVMELLIHPIDAAARGIEAGDDIEVHSATGSLTATARVADSICPGTVSLPHGYANRNVNTLISAHDLDSISGMARLSGTVVTIRCLSALNRG